MHLAHFSPILWFCCLNRCHVADTARFRRASHRDVSQTHPTAPRGAAEGAAPCTEPEIPQREQSQTEEFRVVKPQHSEIMSQTPQNHGTGSINPGLTQFSLPGVFKNFGCLYRTFLSSSITMRAKIWLVFIFPSN